MTVSVSSQARSIISRWTEGWSASDQQKWVKLHTQDVQYTDHAFQLRRRGHAGLQNHAKIWKDAHPDFKIEADGIWLEELLAGGKSRLVFKTINTGTFVHDLPAIKANGKTFWFPGVVELIVRNEDGLIELINEWYTFKFDGVSSIDEYDTRD